MTISEQIRKILENTLSPTHMDIQDNSAKHAGHAGARPGGESHFSVHIISDKFSGLSRIARHRIINEALSGLFLQGLHALEINAKSPEER